MGHYNLYQSLGLDRSSSSEDLAAELDRLLGQSQHGNAGGAAELEVARSILGNPEKRALYDGRLDDPNASEITIGSLRALSQRPDSTVSGAQGGFGQSAEAAMPQYAGPHYAGPQASGAQYAAKAGEAPRYDGAQAQGGYGQGGYGQASGAFVQAQSPQQQPQVPQALAVFAGLPLSEKILRVSGVLAFVAAVFAVLSVCFRWFTISSGRDKFILFAFKPVFEGTDPPDPENGAYVWLCIGVPMLLIAVALVVGGLLLLKGGRQTTGGMVLVGSAIALSSVRLMPDIVIDFAGSRFLRQLFSVSGENPIRVETGAGMVLSLIAAIIVWLVALVFIAITTWSLLATLRKGAR